MLVGPGLPSRGVADIYTIRSKVSDVARYIVLHHHHQLLSTDAEVHICISATGEGFSATGVHGSQEHMLTGSIVGVFLFDRTHITFVFVWNAILIPLSLGGSICEIVL